MVVLREFHRSGLETLSVALHPMYSQCNIATIIGKIVAKHLALLFVAIVTTHVR
jgi:hypothetical protein